MQRELIIIQMVATKKLIKELFEKYNTLYFNNELPLCTFTTHSSFKKLGEFSFIKNKWSRNHMSYKTISITDCYDFKECELKHILIHEMIHYYIAYKFNKIEGNFDHGIEFITMMSQLNKKHNLKIRPIYNMVMDRAPGKSILLWWWYNKVIG